MTHDDDRPDEYDGGGRIIARIPFNSGPSANEVWRLYKKARSFSAEEPITEPQLQRRYCVKRRGPDSLYLDFNNYDDEA